jgi:resuscitation-promoting factor RpfA
MDCEAKALTVMAGALGIVAAMTLSAPTVLADPSPVPEPAPAPAPPPPPPPLFPWLAPPAAPVAAPADPGIPAPAPPPGPVPEGTVQSAAGDPAVPHLPSPENLPPGTSDTPVPQQGNGSYLRDLWHAYQTQEISGRDALLLLTQRPMDADAVPPPGMPANPTPPLPPAPLLPEAAPAPPPAP